MVVMLLLPLGGALVVVGTSAWAAAVQERVAMVTWERVVKEMRERDDMWPPHATRTVSSHVGALLRTMVTWTSCDPISICHVGDFSQTMEILDIVWPN